MNAEEKVVSLNQYRDSSQQALIDDISAQAFLFLREEAETNRLPMKSLLLEHLLGIALVVKAVEGTQEAQQVLMDVAEQLGRH